MRKLLSAPQDVFDEGERTVYIHDIAFRQIDKLREDLRDLVEIRNFLPLMNRVKTPPSVRSILKKGADSL